MALTFRTGSGGKNSALTIEELDNNFRHFTGSHSITGSLIISSSLIVSGSMGISGSIIPSQASSTLGTVDNPWGDLFVSDSSIIFVSGSTTSSFGVDESGSLSGSISNATSASFATTALSATSASYADNTPYNSGSCLIGCTSSTIPTGTRPEGTFEFVVSGSAYLMYVYLDGGWRYTILT
jgi:hypothetical protein